jgi:hypothetical protein
VTAEHFELVGVICGSKRESMPLPQQRPNHNKLHTFTINPSTRALTLPITVVLAAACPATLPALDVSLTAAAGTFKYGFSNNPFGPCVGKHTH